MRLFYQTVATLPSRMRRLIFAAIWILALIPFSVQAFPSNFSSDDQGFVTLTTQQTISGQKTFSATLFSTVGSGNVAISLLDGERLKFDTAGTNYLFYDTGTTSIRAAGKLSAATSLTTPHIDASPIASGADITATGAQSDVWNEAISSTLSITTTYGGYWNNPSHNANFFDGTHAYAGTSTNHPYQLRTSNIGRFIIFGGGNVAIGAQADDGAHTFQLTGTMNATGTISSTVGSGSDAVSMSAGRRVNFGGRSLFDSGSGLQSTSGNFQGDGIKNLSTTVPVGVSCNVTDAASRICAVVQPANTLSTTTARMLSVQNPANTEIMGVFPNGSIVMKPATLMTCAAANEGAISPNAAAGGTSGARTQICLCTSDGAGTPAYAWQNMVSGTVGTTTTCSP